jgi:hypothetical protein
MALDSVRRHMESDRSLADAEANASRDPQIVPERLRTWYRSLGPDDRLQAHSVLMEWLASEDEALRFDALALVDDFMIASSAPALAQLAVRLKSSTLPGAPYELKKVNRVRARLVAVPADFVIVSELPAKGPT